MGTVVVDEASSQPLELVPLTVEQYHHIRVMGILDEDAPVELLNGLLVQKDRGEQMPVSPLHALVTSRLMRLASEIEAGGCHLRVQNPITIPPSHEPEPDGAVVRGCPEAYLEHHPLPQDVLCLIEIADSSLSRDRTTKQRIYAVAEIPQYLIVNLTEQRVEIYEEPHAAAGHYSTVRIVHREETVSLSLDEQQLQIPASRLLP